MSTVVKNPLPKMPIAPRLPAQPTEPQKVASDDRITILLVMVAGIFFMLLINSMKYSSGEAPANYRSKAEPTSISLPIDHHSFKIQEGENLGK